MTHTTNFNLSQWAKSDRIQMADFNADNAKIDAALAALSTRRCQLYTTTYVGTGSGPRSFTFPHKPRIVFVMGGEIAFMVGTQGVPFFLTMFFSNGYETGAVWEGNTVTWQDNPGGSDFSCNASGETYTLTALLDAED